MVISMVIIIIVIVILFVTIFATFKGLIGGGGGCRSIINRFHDYEAARPFHLHHCIDLIYQNNYKRAPFHQLN